MVPCLRIATAALQVACCAGGLAGTAQAQMVLPPMTAPQLERAYWQCIRDDEQHAAGADRMDANDISRCAVISKALQVRRFGDDFGKLHEWTQANKRRMLAEALPRSAP